MFDSKEIAKRALQRAEVIKRERAARKRRIMAIASAAACLVLIVGLSVLIPAALPDSAIPETPGATSATLLADGAVGGYVLIGVIGFVLGAAVVLLYHRTKK